MKNTMKKITAALLALCCVPMTGMTAGAEDYGWDSGSTTWAGLEYLEKVDLSKYGGTEVYVDANNNHLISVKPRQNTMRFVMLDAEQDGAMDALVDEVTEIVKAYIPDVQYNPNYYDGYPLENAMLVQTSTRMMGRRNAFELHVPDGVKNKAEIESGILLALARKHLISEFYGWGETAQFNTAIIYYRGEMHYDIFDPSYYEQREIKLVTPEGVEAYLAEHHPEYTLECIDGDFGDYVLHGTESLTACERVELIYELRYHLGLEYMFAEYPSEGEMTTGRNALERKGDVDLDTALTIVDVIALNRNLMVGDPLCNTAQKNADIDGDGTPDETDSLAILKEIVEITKDFQEQ